MKYLIGAMLGLAGLAVSCTSAGPPAPPANSAASKPFWVVAYYPGWQQTYMPPQAINLKAITHLVYFALLPTAAGGLDPNGNGVNDATAAQLASKVHAAQKKILICVGGENTGPAFHQAITPSVRPTFVKNIVTWIARHGFDGVDVDMEPVSTEDTPNYRAFITSLRAALDAHARGMLLTAAVQYDPTPFVPIQAKFDQINVMTYDISGTYEGWETWYDASLYNGGRKFRSNGQPIPCADLLVNGFVKAGIAKAKLGLGIHFHGVVWHGAAGPNQPITGVKTEGLDYNTVAKFWYQPTRYHWDAGAHAPYLSIVSATAAKRAFVSYENERSCQEKITYTRANGFGGVIIWELTGDYNPAKPIAQRDPLMAAIRAAVGAGP